MAEEKFIQEFKRNCGSLGIHISDDGRLGIGRNPLYTYKMDINLPSNCVGSGLHIGNGVSGFTFGNGTSKGFVPQIIGVGGSEDDASLNFIGRSNNLIKSSVPLVVIDGRNSMNQVIVDRPLLGVTSADYKNYKFVVDYNGDIKCSGDVYSKGLNITTEIERLKNEVIELKKVISCMD